MIATVYTISVYTQTINFYPSTYLNACNRNNYAKMVERLLVLLFLDQQQHECRFECQWSLSSACFVAAKHGTITGLKAYRGLEKSFSKPLKNCVIPFRYTVYSLKDGKCMTPSMLCSEERTSHMAPPPSGAAGLRAVSESQLWVWWWPKEMNPCYFFPRRKTRSLPYGHFSGNVD